MNRVDSLFAALSGVLNHQPHNSKAREGQPSAGSNPAATATVEKQVPRAA
jgi:hypothetical protein